MYNGIAAKPVIYKGIKYPSKTEWRWKLFYEYLGLGEIHEPFILKSKDNKVTYKPDFILSSGIYMPREGHHNEVLIEVKPKRPTPAWLANNILPVLNSRTPDLLLVINYPEKGWYQPQGYWLTYQNDVAIIKAYNFFGQTCPVCGRYNFFKFGRPIIFYCEALHSGPKIKLVPEDDAIKHAMNARDDIPEVTPCSEHDDRLGGDHTDDPTDEDLTDNNNGTLSLFKS